MEFYLKAASKILVISAFFWCVWIGHQIWTTPVTYKGIEVMATPDGNITKKELTKTRKFSEISALGALPLCIPVIITLVAMWSIFSFNIIVLVVATVLLSVFWFLSGFSVGMAYTPAVVLLVFVSAINLIARWQNKRKNV